MRGDAAATSRGARFGTSVRAGASCTDTRKIHQRTCRSHLEQVGYPLDKGLHGAILNELGVAAVLRAERELGKRVLTDPALLTMRWPEFRDLIWSLADSLGQSDA